MKKTNFFLLLLILIGFIRQSVFAQDIYLGIKAGPSIPGLTGGTTEQSKDFKFRYAPFIGIFSSMQFKNQLGMRLEISYLGQGAIKNKYQLIGPGMINYPGLPSTDLYADFKNRLILNYLDIPLLVNYTITIEKIYDIYFQTGPDLGLLLSAKNKVSGTSQIYTDNAGTPLTDGQGTPLPPATFDRDINVKEDFNTLNFGITAGIGVSSEYNTGDLLLEFRGLYGLTDIRKDPLIGNNHTLCLMVTLGYRLKYSPFRKIN